MHVPKIDGHKKVSCAYIKTRNFHSLNQFNFRSKVDQNKNVINLWVQTKPVAGNDVGTF